MLGEHNMLFSRARITDTKSFNVVDLAFSRHAKYTLIFYILSNQFCVFFFFLFLILRCLSTKITYKMLYVCRDKYKNNKVNRHTKKHIDIKNTLTVYVLVINVYITCTAYYGICNVLYANFKYKKKKMSV